MAALTLAVIKQNLVSYSCESEGRFQEVNRGGQSF